MPDFGAVREDPCVKCGGKVTYRYGNWSCTSDKGCGWSSARLVQLGTMTEERCPECGARVVYNGNYFCAEFGFGCGWALPSPARRQADRDLAARLTGRRYLWHLTS
jgi:hypothetical protein